VGALLGGYRGQRGVNEPALVDAILRVSRMACELDALAELDVNPLLVDAGGVLALDARIRVRHAVQGEGGRLALRPYPAGLEETLVLGQQQLLVRPIRPEDGARLAAFYAGASASDLRLRFFLSRHEVPVSELARYCQIDYDREMAFIALDGDRMVAEVRAVCDPDNVEAEFAIQVAASHQHRGLGRLLLDKMLAYLGARGTREIHGECLPENRAMMELAREAGFSVVSEPKGIVRLYRACAGVSAADPGK
jgi:acetyltransferase